ncbi:hypothetical protein [Phaffia rhodozyma]|uniref:Uncharacterized protein n=1 Tax=Phaffia rhodozyma TaxID=264483 RepID=A0A0F7SFS0_PHARH|nr:hypothetical protein [Phaffia rhodozyma]
MSSPQTTLSTSFVIKEDQIAAWLVEVEASIKELSKQKELVTIALSQDCDDKKKFNLLQMWSCSREALMANMSASKDKLEAYETKTKPMWAADRVYQFLEVKQLIRGTSA